MTRGTLRSAIVCATLCAGCLPPRLLASRDIPHLVAEETQVIGWCRNKEGKVEKCRIEVLPGDVIAPQEILKVEARAPGTDL